MRLPVRRAVFHTMLVACLLSVVGYSHATNVKTYIPTKAWELRDDVKDAIDSIFPEIPEYNFIPALIEHESCISLTHSRCWSSNIGLNTSREKAVGFFQLTVAYDANGNVRFDTLSDLARRYKNEIGELTWKNAVSRPDLQIKAGVILVRENFNYFRDVKDPIARLHFTDAAHNAGAGNIGKERRACGLAAGCDPQYWIDNTERYCQRSRKPLYAGRSACDITQHHVRDVFFTRLPKYKEKYIVFPLEEEVFEEEPEVVEEVEEVVIVEATEEVEEEPKQTTGFLAFLKRLFGG